MTTTWTDARIMHRLIELGGLRLAENTEAGGAHLAAALACANEPGAILAALVAAEREQVESAEAAFIAENPQLKPPTPPPFDGNADPVATKRLRPTGKERR